MLLKVIIDGKSNEQKASSFGAPIDGPTFDLYRENFTEDYIIIENAKNYFTVNEIILDCFFEEEEYQKKSSVKDKRLHSTTTIFSVRSRR